MSNLNGSNALSQTSLVNVPSPYTVNRIICFDWWRYACTSRSYGLVAMPKWDQKIYLGTDFRVIPVVINNKVELGNIGTDRNREPLQPEMVEVGKEVVMEVIDGVRGLWGRWCFKSEWDAAVKIHQEACLDAARKLEIEQAATERQITDTPKSVEQALSHGWQVQTESGRQVIVFRMVDGNKKTRTFVRPLQRKTHPARDRQGAF